LARGELRSKRKPNISKSLTESAISAFLAMVEIHNKPKIEYRYPVSVILMINAWELILKSYIYKYISHQKIWKDSTHSITICESLNVLTITKLKYFSKNEIIVLKKNIESLEKYRNEFIHYNLGDLDPIIFGLLYKSTLLFTDFLAKAFKKDVGITDNLIIMPIGLKLPYDPVSFLRNQAIAKNDFYTFLIKETKELLENNITDSIFIGLDVKYESIKKISNSDIIVGIDPASSTKVEIIKKIRTTNDPNAQTVYISDENLLKEFPLSYKLLVKRIKENFAGFKTNKYFYTILKVIKSDGSLTYQRKFNPSSTKTSVTYFYKNEAVEAIIKHYENR